MIYAYFTFSSDVDSSPSSTSSRVDREKVCDLAPLLERVKESTVVAGPVVEESEIDEEDGKGDSEKAKIKMGLQWMKGIYKQKEQN